MAHVLPEFSNPRIDKPAGIAIDWKYNGIEKTLRIEQFSDGYRTTLAMVMDIAARMAEANPAMREPLETEGVVMIDEVDLHLHPGWQQTILLDLMKAFPNVQFIVTTHSPQVISSVKPDNLRVMEWADEKPTIADVQFSEGAEAQQMLLDVLGVDSARVRQLKIVEALEEYQKLVEADKWDTKRAKELHSRLMEWGNGFDPELAKLDVDVRMKECERSTGKVEVIKANCLSANICSTTAQRTIDELNLNASRLNRLRKTTLDAINQNIKSAADAGQTYGQARMSMARATWSKGREGNWPQFFTSIRSYLGAEAEQHLREMGYDG